MIETDARRPDNDGDGSARRIACRVTARHRCRRKALVALLLSPAVAAALSPPDPASDIPWDEDASRAGEQHTFDGVASIEAAFTNARRAEERRFELEPDALGDLELPAPADWQALGIAQQALLITNAERTARGGVAYPDGAPLGLPLEGVETHVDDLSKAYARYLLANDYWAHRAPEDGPPPFAGTTPFERIGRDATIGDAAGDDGAACHQFLGQAENLAVFASSPGRDIALPIARSIYGFIYADAGSAWGHRHLMLLQDRPLEGRSGGFTNDVGDESSEGFLGVGTAGASDGSYSVFDDTDTFPVQRNVVLMMIDPVPDPGCAYSVEAG